MRSERRLRRGGDLADRDPLPAREADLAWRERRLAEWQQDLARLHVEHLDAVAAAEAEAAQRLEALEERERVLAAEAASLQERERSLADRLAEHEASARQLRASARRLLERELELAAPTLVRGRPIRIAVHATGRSEEPFGLPERELVVGDTRRGISLNALEPLVAACDPADERVETWRYYLLFLAEHADEDGLLPVMFEPLVRDVFADLL